MSYDNSRFPQQIEVADTTDALYKHCKGLRTLVMLDAENIAISARKSFAFANQRFRIDWDALAARLLRVCPLVDLHACASGTDEHDMVGGPFRSPWRTDVFPIGLNDKIKDEAGKKLLDADLLLAYMVGQLLPRKRYQALVIASGDGTLGSSIARIVKRQFPDINVITLSLAGSTSPRLNAETNKNIDANFEIGYDLFVPFDQPIGLKMPTLWQRFSSFCYNLLHAS